MTGLPDAAARPLMGAEEARHACGDPCGRSAWYESIARGDVPGVVRLGTRVFLSTAVLRRWVGLDPAVDDSEEPASVELLRAVECGGP